MTFNRWRIQLFGVLKISSGEEVTTRFRTQMTGAILAYLAFHNGRPQPREVLVDLFWPDIDNKSARQRLANALSALRSQLARSEGGTEVLLTDYSTVALNPDIFETDLAGFQNALKRARRATEPSEKRLHLEEAIGYYTGDFLSGRYDLWIISEQDRLRQQFELAKKELESVGGSEPSQPNLPASTIQEPDQESGVLPRIYTRFFGRTQEMDQLIGELTSPHVNALITLTGMGGIGKTRLAQEAGRRLQDRFQGRVWFVPLAELHDGNRLAAAIRDVVRLPKDQNLEPLDQCAAFLSSLPSLLILDNMEQLAQDGHAAALLQELRERVPSLVCLVTSRQLLRVSGEFAFAVGPLTDTEEGKETCLALFEDRARAVLPAFRITDTNRSVILRLCTALDGIPLAIELAAARVSVISPANMLSQVETRFAILRSRRRDVPERHRSLWAAIDSSYQLLPADLQRFFVRLSVFRGGWTLAAATAICLDRSDVDTNDGELVALDAIAELQESSLIYFSSTEDDTNRFQMLDTLREYAAEQLKTQGGELETRQRHADYFAHLVSEAEPYLTAGMAAQNVWLDKLERDHDNLRVALSTDVSPERALRVANGLRRFWLIRNYHNEGRAYLRSALEASRSKGEVSESDLATTQFSLGLLSLGANAPTEARPHFDDALRHYERLGNLEDIAKAVNNVGIVAAQTGDFIAARDAYERSRQIYRELRDQLRESMVLSNLAAVLLYLEDYGAARRVLEESAPIQRDAGDDFSLSRTLQNLAIATHKQGDLSAAAATMQESLVIRRSLRDQSGFDETLASVSIILGSCKRMEDACVAWAVARKLRAVSGSDATPANAADEAVWSEHLQKELPPIVVAEMESKGNEMDFDQAISFVIQSLSHVADTSAQS